MTHLGEQIARFARIFGLAFLAQAGALDWTHLDRSALISVAIATAETGFRQIFKVTKPVQ